jgi:tripartite-type tricarboxylate transporter receptor subunit TctC
MLPVYLADQTIGEAGMKILRSFSWLGSIALAGVIAVAASSTASAQEKFEKPIRIVVGFAAGGTADLIARVVADKLKDSLGVPVIVDNRPGAIGRIAAEAENAPPGRQYDHGDAHRADGRRAARVQRYHL